MKVASQVEAFLENMKISFDPGEQKVHFIAKNGQKIDECSYEDFRSLNKHVAKPRRKKTD